MRLLFVRFRLVSKFRCIFLNPSSCADDISSSDDSPVSNTKMRRPLAGNVYSITLLCQKNLTNRKLPGEMPKITFKLLSPLPRVTVLCPETDTILPWTVRAVKHSPCEVAHTARCRMITPRVPSPASIASEIPPWALRQVGPDYDKYSSII